MILLYSKHPKEEKEEKSKALGASLGVASAGTYGILKHRENKRKKEQK